MNADHLIKRLCLIEHIPRVVWTALHKEYGEDYFLEVIEEEYGISPEANLEL